MESDLTSLKLRLVRLEDSRSSSNFEELSLRNSGRLKAFPLRCKAIIDH